MVQIIESPGQDPRYLSVYVIAFNPRDYPGLYTVRRHEARPTGPVPKELLGTATTLDQARELIPPGLVMFQRDPNDDPVLVESWL